MLNQAQIEIEIVSNEKKERNLMLDNSNITSVTIAKLPDGKFFLNWFYEHPIEDSIGGQCIIGNIIDVLAYLIDPHKTPIVWDKVERQALMLHAYWLEPEWEFLDEFAAHNGISRQTVYKWIAAGKIETSKLGRFTLVREKSNAST